MSKKIFFILLTLFCLNAVSGFTPHKAVAETSDLCNPQKTPESSPIPGWCLGQFKDDPAKLSDPTQARGYLGAVLSTGMNLFIIVGALAAFVMFVIGGIQYITANDSAENARKARQTMLYAGVGLIIMSVTYIFIIFYNSLWPAAK